MLIGNEKCPGHCSIAAEYRVDRGRRAGVSSVANGNTRLVPSGLKPTSSRGGVFGHREQNSATCDERQRYDGNIISQPPSNEAHGCDAKRSPREPGKTCQKTAGKTDICDSDERQERFLVVLEASRYWERRGTGHHPNPPVIVTRPSAGVRDRGPPIR